MPEPPDPDGEVTDSAGEDTTDAEIAAMDGDPVDDAAETERRALVHATLEAIPRLKLRALMQKLTAIARVFGMDGRFAADIADDALLRVVEHKAKWDPRKGELLPYLRKVVQILVLRHLTRGQNVHEVAPESDRFENAPRSDPNAEAVKVTLEERDEGQERFALITRRFAGDVDAMGVVRSAQKGIEKAEEQAAHLNLPDDLVHAARRRLKETMKRLYAKRPEAPRLRKLARRGVHAKKGQATNEGENE